MESIQDILQYLSLAASVLLVVEIVYLLYSKTHGSGIKKFHSWVLVLSLIYLLFSSALVCVLVAHQTDRNALVIFFKIGLVASINVDGYVFLSYCLYCYCRLCGVDPGSTEYRFWGNYKNVVGVVAVIQIGLASALAIKGHDILSISRPEDTTGIVLLWMLIPVFLLFCVLSMAANIFSFSLILRKVLNTSTKIARLQRACKGHLVHSFRRRILTYILAAGVLGTLAIGSLFAGLAMFQPHLTLGAILVMLYLLEAISTGLADLGKPPKESMVTELSSVYMMPESQVERLERME